MPFCAVQLNGEHLVQVPPITLHPTVSLEAIFALMNHMALELVPIVSAGGIFHGLLTRACLMRFQRKLDAEGPRAGRQHARGRSA